MTILLLNKAVGGSHRIYPCCGKSGKLYGNAILGNQSCPEFRMSLEEYEANKFDLIGQLGAGQQWTPQFEGEDTELQELRQWKKAQMQVLAELDLQAIGLELGMTLGQSISPAILPAIRALKAQVPDPLLKESITVLRGRAKKDGIILKFGDTSKESIVAAIRAKEKETP